MSILARVPSGRALVPILLAVAACTPTGGGATPTVAPSGTADASSCGPAPSALPSGWPQGAADFVPIIVSSERAVGETRFLVSLADRQNRPIAAPDVPVQVSFHELTTAPGTAVATQEAEFIWSLEGELGLYRSSVDFTCSGPWGVAVTATLGGGEPQTARAAFDVRPRGTTPPIGGAAPSVPTPTASDEGTARTISTDDDPDLDFYRESLDDALAGDEPVVLAFATPAFCASRVCAPTLDAVKGVARDYKDEVAFVHAEPYELQLVDGALQPSVDANGQPRLTAAATAYGLPVEPYVFVIAADGTVAAKFEGVVGQDELRAAIDEVAG